MTSHFAFQPCVSENDLEEDPSWKVVKFGRTPVMSTYLVAYVVGEYDYISGKDSDGVQVRVYTPVGKKEQGQFALEVLCLIIVSCICAKILRSLNWVVNRLNRWHSYWFI